MEHMEHLTRQLEMPLFHAVGAPEMVSEMLISRLHSEHQALVLCWAKRRVKYSISDAAALMEMPKSHLSNIISGKKYLPFDKRITFQCLCGNWAIRQFEDRVIGAQTVFETPEQREIRVLRQELAARAA